MNELGKAINGYTKPIVQLLDALAGDTPPAPLDMAALCRQVEDLVDLVKRANIPAANKAFNELLAKAKPDEKSWAVLDNQASVSRYSPRATWTYSSEVVKLQADLVDKQKKEQDSGVAKKLVPAIDSTRSSLFAVTIKEMPITPPKPA